jgi:hypothetical protein
MPGSPSPAVAQRRARLASKVRHHPDADTAELRRDLAAELLAEHVRRVVGTFPPLSDEQRSLIVDLLSPSAAGGDAT